MAVKTFAVGELATAADVNLYLANSGLVYVAAGTLSLTTTATNVTGVFNNANYKNYRLLLNVTTRSTTNRVDMRYIVGTTMEVTNYFQGGIGSDHAANSAVYYQRSTNDPQFYGQSTTAELSMSFDIFNANKAANTLHQGNVVDRNLGYNYTVGGMNRTSSQFTGFALFTSTGTATVEYQVMGYRDQ
jgi:hypothetical protein